MFCDGCRRGAFGSGADESKVRAQARVGTVCSRAASPRERVTLAGVAADEA